MIDAVAVVIPARDEAATIGACLDSVLASLGELDNQLATAVWVVADRCRDSTEHIGRDRLRAVANAGIMVNRSKNALGRVRHAGVACACRALGNHPPERIWLLHTDADTTVPAEWARTHLRYAEAGAHAVAGLADLNEMTKLSSTVRRQYHAVLANQRDADSHRHVYGANLGVRADVYHAVGGFAALSTGEDHDLIARLRERGYRIEHPTDLRVSTSGRLHGRARGGVADLLRRLDTAALPGNAVPSPPELRSAE